MMKEPMVCTKCDREPDVQSPEESDVAGRWRVYCDECAACAHGRDRADAIYIWDAKQRKIKA